MLQPISPEDEEAAPDGAMAPRYLEGWRKPLSDSGKALIEYVCQRLIEHELATHARTRRRKQRDQEIFKAAVTGLVSDLVYDVLSTSNRGLLINRSHRVIEKISRYRSPAFTSTLPRLLDQLASPSLDLICQEVGVSGLHGLGRATVIKAGPQLTALVSKHELTLQDFGIQRGREVIVLKGLKRSFWDDASYVEYRETEETLRYRREMQFINFGLSEADIEFEPTVMAKPRPVDSHDRHLRRIFTRNSFTSGGRLFGGFWQGLKQRERLDGILIDGEIVVSLDFGQMAPRLLYAVCGVEPNVADCYAIPGLEGYREGSKKLFNALLFAEEPLDRKPKETGKLLPQNRSIAELVDLIKSAHPNIRSYFNVGVGHTLQFQESQILVKVLIQLLCKGVVALPVHDAIVVPKSKADTALTVMRDVFHSFTGHHAVVRQEA